MQQRLIVGSPIPVLAQEARRAQLLVLGDRGLGQVEGLLVGSVAGALAPHGPCPVVVIRGDGQPSASLPVVVGVDAHSDDAIAFAFEAAAARRVSVVAVHSWWQPVFEPEMAGVLFDREAIQAEEERILAQRMAGWTEKYPGVFVERRVIADSPARGLLEQARAAQLVVVGSRVGGLSLRWSSDRSGTSCCTARRAPSPWYGPKHPLSDHRDRGRAEGPVT